MLSCRLNQTIQNCSADFNMTDYKSIKFDVLGIARNNFSDVESPEFPIYPRLLHNPLVFLNSSNFSHQKNLSTALTDANTQFVEGIQIRDSKCFNSIVNLLRQVTDGDEVILDDDSRVKLIGEILIAEKSIHRRTTRF